MNSICDSHAQKIHETFGIHEWYADGGPAVCLSLCMEMTEQWKFAKHFHNYWFASSSSKAAKHWTPIWSSGYRPANGGRFRACQMSVSAFGITIIKSTFINWSFTHRNGIESNRFRAPFEDKPSISATETDKLFAAIKQNKLGISLNLLCASILDSQNAKIYIQQHHSHN